jgi:type IV secretory pathway VirB6-like protein
VSETDDAVATLGPDVRRWVVIARAAAKWLAAAVLAIVTAIGTYRSATGDAQIRVQATKNKAEAGYQVTRQAYEALEQRVAELEAAARRSAGDAHRPHGAPRRPAPRRRDLRHPLPSSPRARCPPTSTRRLAQVRQAAPAPAPVAA